MRHLVNHLLKSNLAEIMAKSCRNCHVMGMHSIMLSECPGKTIRLFVADPSNELWKNHHCIKEPQSIAFHSHHCQLTLSCTRGSLMNVVGKLSGGPDTHPFPPKAVTAYRYTSAIRNGTGGFEALRQTNVWLGKETATAHEDESIFMEASVLHTVATPKNEWAAWLVFEGKEDPDYDSTCYSNANLSMSSLDGLYGKFNSVDEVRHLLNEANLL